MFRAVALVLLLPPAVGAADLHAASFEEVKTGHASSEAWLLDRHGEVLQTFRANPAERRLEWVALPELSPALTESLIAAEDRRFLDHAGVDWQALVGAAWSNLRRGGKAQRNRGASTLTMQLAGMLDPTLTGSRTGRSVGQKWDQIVAARGIEKRWTKAQILEAYLNLVRFRGELAGIGAASRGLFGKAPSGIDRQEAALLVALLRGPAASPAIVGTRACSVARTVDPVGANCNEIEQLAYRTLDGAYRLVPEQDLAPHLRKLSGKAGSRTRTTLDASLQRAANDFLHQQLAELSGRNMEDGAIVVLDNASGDVLAYVGSSGRMSRAGAVDGADAPRQAGSTLKPFLYALALEQRMLTAASILDDSPLALPTDAGLYVPQNYDKGFKGPVTLRSALGSSLNVPAVRTLSLVGFDAFRDRLRAVGLETIDQPGAYYGFALALGSPEVTLLQLTNAYRSLANGGRFGPVRWTVDSPPAPRQRAMDEGAAFIVADILADPGARATTFGLDNSLVMPFWSAVKTGTSKDMRDNWCIGFSQRYTVGVWVGNAGGEPMRNVSGVTGAAPIWHDLMRALHTKSPPQEPRPPRNVFLAPVRWDGMGTESSRAEWFLSTQGDDRGSRTVVAADAAGPHIEYPRRGAVLAMDPDIPPELQLVLFRARVATSDPIWTIDGETAPGGRWMPRAGHHELQLRSGGEQILDNIEFEVR